jgi:endonuclease/exonuclease/phosphatase family metal-dependent hydrolase
MVPIAGSAVNHPFGAAQSMPQVPTTCRFSNFEPPAHDGDHVLSAIVHLQGRSCWQLRVSLPALPLCRCLGLPDTSCAQRGNGRRGNPVLNIRRLSVALALCVLGQACAAGVLRIASWNLGWHVSSDELARWTTQCSRHYVKDASGVWRLAAAGDTGARRGWEVTESRAVLEGVDPFSMPPCAVYMTAAKQGLPVTPAAYARRNVQIAALLAGAVRPDVIAFQEVSGTAAVREALGSAAADYFVCSFDGAYKVQRLAFAWKRTHGPAEAACADIKPVSLPHLQALDQPRPAYMVTLRLQSKRIGFLTVHLKSGCVTPLEGDVLDVPGASDNPCRILQQQVAPLEAAFEQLASEVDHFVVLGDFNRNLWHEFNKVTGAEPRRSNGQSDLTAAHSPGVASRNLLLEINDGVPAASRAVLLAIQCPGAPAVQAACDAAKTGRLNGAQRTLLASPAVLGCRNPVGLDFGLVSNTLAPAVRSVTKLSVGEQGSSWAAGESGHSEAQLAVSDHCPLVAEIEL